MKNEEKDATKAMTSALDESGRAYTMAMKPNGLPILYLDNTNSADEARWLSMTRENGALAWFMLLGPYSAVAFSAEQAMEDLEYYTERLQ